MKRASTSGLVPVPVELIGACNRSKLISGEPPEAMEQPGSDQLT
jgi:hypothetical protein